MNMKKLLALLLALTLSLTGLCAAAESEPVIDGADAETEIVIEETAEEAEDTILKGFLAEEEKRNAAAQQPRSFFA